MRSRKTEITAVWIRHADHATPLYPQTLALTSPTKATELLQLLLLLLLLLLSIFNEWEWNYSKENIIREYAEKLRPRTPK
jgi:hypothetical protein